MPNDNSVSWDSPPTSEQQVAVKLREAILSGSLPMGEFLSQRKLAELAESSVISVRGALRQLENEGLVENVPRMGARIPIETPSGVRNRYLIRIALETAAVELVCGNLPPDTVDRLMTIATRLDELMAMHSTENYSEFAQLHQEFHLLIAESAGNPLLVQLLKRVINPSTMLLNASRAWKAPEKNPERHHTKLMEAIMSGDLGKAVQEMQSHIQVGLESELATL